MNTPRPIRFFHRGRIVSVQSAPTRSVLQWLREDAACTGTKEGCNEGDCGACTVVVAELADAPGPDVVQGLRLRSVNACIRFLPTLDGKALLTVEDLKPAAGGQLHPVQQALVDCHGSQCGFCTPGFAMSLSACYERHCEAGTRPTRQALADELAGNLCRCTGYRPLLDAGQKMFDYSTVRLDTAPIVQALQSLRQEPALSLPGYEAPRTLEELATLREAQPQATLLAGATDIGLWHNKQFRPLPQLLYVGEVRELQAIEQDGDVLRIGAAASLEDAWSALADAVPEVREVWLRFASPPVRHAGTLGGNVANGSPIGDGAPVLMALGATLVLRRGARERRLPLQDFYVDYMKNRLEPGEFLQAIEVPRLLPGATVRVWKISKRYDSDISAVCGAFLLALDGNRVKEARLVFGGMAAIVKHAAHAEAAVVGQPWTAATINAAMTALARDFTPLTDQRASADYRLRVARNLLLKLWLQTRVDAPPLAVEAGSVWQAAA
jgi:xanthine dehydrogenase small subunit